MKIDFPANILISGSTRCRKTHYLLNMLETDCLHMFDVIFLICPTFNVNKTYQGWKYKDDPNFIPICCDQEDVDLWLKRIVNISKDLDACIILDDVASSQSVKNRVSELVRLAFSARHFGITTIVLTQQLTSIAKPYRKNTAKIVAFYDPDEADMVTLLAENLSGTSKAEKDEIIQSLKNNQHTRIEISHRYPFQYEILK